MDAVFGKAVHFLRHFLLCLWIVITVGFIVLRFFDCHYFSWVFIVWLALSVIVAIKGYSRSHTIIGWLVSILLALVITGKTAGIINSESYTDTVNGLVYTYSEPIFEIPVNSIVQQTRSCPYYRYVNFIWYGPKQGDKNYSTIL